MTRQPAPGGARPLNDGDAEDDTEGARGRCEGEGLVLERGTRAKLMPERRKTCIVCEQPLTNVRQIVCHPGECRRIYQTMIRRERRTTWADRKAPKGRQCSICLAYDHETCFTQLHRCETCLQQIQRQGVCEKPHLDGARGHLCGLVLRGGVPGMQYCPAHDPPPFFIEVLWTCEDGRMRKLFRPISGGRVSVGGKLYLVKKNPLSLVVETAKWVSVRV